MFHASRNRIAEDQWLRAGGGGGTEARSCGEGVHCACNWCVCVWSGEGSEYGFDAGGVRFWTGALACLLEMTPEVHSARIQARKLGKARTDWG